MFAPDSEPYRNASISIYGKVVTGSETATQSVIECVKARLRMIEKLQETNATTEEVEKLKISYGMERRDDGNV